MYVSLDEPPSDLKETLLGFGWDFQGIVILDATPEVKQFRKMAGMVDVGSTLEMKAMGDVGEVRQTSRLRLMEVSIHSIQKMMAQEMRAHESAGKKRYSRIVLDSLTALRIFGLSGVEGHLLLQSFFRFLAESEATVLVTTTDLDGATVGPEDLLLRGEIGLHRWVHDRQVHRGITVERFRGSKHDEAMRPIEITNTGMAVKTETAIEDFPGALAPTVSLATFPPAPPAPSRARAPRKKRPTRRKK